MLTGVETAGVVLAAFPIVVQLIQGYKEGCKPIGNWIRFIKTFRTLLQGIRLQETRFNNNVRMLLLPLVDSDEEIDNLIENPSGPAWKDRSLEDALQLRLANSYTSYRETVDRIQETLKAFKKQLGIKDEVRDEILTRMNGSNDSTSSPGLRSSKKIDWKYEWDRIKISWAQKELIQLIEELADLNSGLATLLSDGEKITVLEQKRTNRKSRSVQQLREHAAALYTFLARQWPCSCEPSHSARVLLRHQEPAHSTPGFSFEIALAYECAEGTRMWRGAITCTNTKLKWNCVAKTTLKQSGERRAPKRVSFQDNSTFITKNPSLENAKASLTRSTKSPTTITQAAEIESTITIEPDSLCNILRKDKSCVNQLGPFIEDGRQLYLIPTASAKPDSNIELQLSTLADELRASNITTRIFSLRARIHLAVDLASSFFYIYGTPWYMQGWGKEKIKLARETEKDRNMALLEHRFPDKGKMHDPLTQNAQDAFTCLGICLEELCFGRPLESFSEYAKYCDANGQPHSQTLRNAADDLSRHIRGQLGDHYHDAVQKCFAHAYLASSTQCASPEFWQSAHDEVVEPLKKVLQGFIST